MKQFIVETEWSGTTRGWSRFIVEAETAEEAKKEWCFGTLLKENPVSDEIDHEVTSVEEYDARPQQHQES